MESKKLGNHIEYNPFLISDKHYFGGYLNLAQNNIDDVFNAFADKFNLHQKKNNTELIRNYFDESKTILEFQQGIDYLQQHFPVIKYLFLPITASQFEKNVNERKEAERRKYFTSKFITLLENIWDLRNFYTHHYHNPLHFDSCFFSLLDSLFLLTIEDVKKHKMKDDKTRHILKKSLNQEILELKKEKRKKLEEEKSILKKLSLKEEDIENAVLNDAFFHLLYKKNSVNKDYKSEYTFTEEGENKLTLSQNGLLFLLGMFLSRKQSEDLRSRIKGFKAKVIRNPEKCIDRNNNSLKFMATHWVFNYLAYKGLKHRLTTTFSKETLLVQIVDELSKVPDEVYCTFTDANKKQFIEDINEYIQDRDELEPLGSSIVIHPVIRKRYENKFNYFVLRYLDEFANFPNLRFQIHLGNYVHDKQIKSIEGTIYKTDRIIKEKINVFGKLSIISSLKTDYFYKKDSKDSVGWEVFPNPSYNLVGDNIPIFINLQKNKIQEAKELYGEICKLKSRQNCREKVAKKDFVNQIDDKLTHSKFENVYVGTPTAYLSVNELPSLLYELLVQNKTGEEIENILVTKLIERFEIIKNYNVTTPLPTSQISKKIRKGSNELIIDTEKLIRAFENELNITNQKIQLILHNKKELSVKNAKRKFVFTNREIGQEASWLANDLKRFMPKSLKSKWRGRHHSQLQQSLAFFNQRPNEVKEFLAKLWNWNDDSYLWNNGIKKAFQNSTFELLYETYLINRKQLFTDFIANLSDLKIDSKLLKKFLNQQYIWEIFHKRLYIIDTIDNQKNKLLTQPMVFPRGIFDKNPTYIKGKNIENNPELFADWYVYYYNSTFQKFYSYEKDYKDLFQKEPISETNTYNLTKDEQFDLFKRKQDKKIKKNKIQDLYLSLIAKSIYFNVYQQEATFNLQDLYISQEDRKRIATRALAQKEKEKGNKSDNIINSNFIWKKTTPFQSKQINEPAVKIKEIGKFKRFLEDKKVKTILSYDDRIWNKLELEQELELLSTSYEVIRREHILKEIQELEKYILKKWGFDGQNHPKALESNKGNPQFKMYITEGLLKKFHLGSEEDINWLLSLNEGSFEIKKTFEVLLQKEAFFQRVFLLVLVRNKVSHNQLPKKEFYELIRSFVTKTPFESYSKILLNFVIQIIAEVKQKTKR